MCGREGMGSATTPGARPAASVANVSGTSAMVAGPARRRFGATGRQLRSAWATALVTIVAVVWTIPTFGLLVTSLRPTELSSYSGWWAAFADRTLTLDNYREVISGGETLPDGVAPYLVNTVAIAVPATVVPIVLGCLAAYAIAWIPFRGATLVLAGAVALQVVPIQMALVPLTQLFYSGWSIGPLHVSPPINPETGRSVLTGTYLPLWVAHTMFALPLAVFLLHHFIARLPRELFEAARIDGASHFTVFRVLVLPLALPAIASLAIFQFLWVWNDLLVALTFASGSPDVAPVTAYLAYLNGGFGSKEYLLASGAFVSIAVPLVVFFALQRYFARGLLAGAMDG